MILGCLTIATTPGDNQVIRTQKFILEDSKGKPSVTMSVDDWYGPRLDMYDGYGLPRTMMTLDKNGKSRAIMGVVKDKTGLVIYDENQKPIWSAP